MKADNMFRRLAILCSLLIGYFSFADGKDYFVKVDGTGDGSSWKNAMSGEDFVANLLLADDGTTFHVAEGTYNFNKLVQGETANVLKEKAGFNIIGSYSKTAVTGDVPNAMLYKTLFSADAPDLICKWTINGDAVYDENLGDLNYLYDVHFSGVDFYNIYIESNNLNSISFDSCHFNFLPETKSTLIYGYKVDTMNINSCYFDMNYVSAALYLYGSDQLNIKNSTFTKCIATFTNGGLMKTEYLKGDAYICNCTFTDCAGRDFINLYRDDNYNGKTYFYNNMIVGNGWSSTGDPMSRFGSLDIRNCVAVGNIYAGNYANDFYSKPLESHDNLFSDNFNNKTDDDLTISDDDLTTILDGEMVDGVFRANLTDNGGFAPTIALKGDKLSDGTSIRFPLTKTIVTTDQRGVTRLKNTCMGSYETPLQLENVILPDTTVRTGDYSEPYLDGKITNLKIGNVVLRDTVKDEETDLDKVYVRKITVLPKYSKDEQGNLHYYVKQDGTGNGSSWSSAMSDIDFAFSFGKVEDGATFHIAEGIYKPLYDINGDVIPEEYMNLDRVFYTTKSVNLQGGYPANVTGSAEPQPQKYHAVFQGVFDNIKVFNLVYYSLSKTSSVKVSGLSFEGSGVNMNPNVFFRDALLGFEGKAGSVEFEVEDCEFSLSYAAMRTQNCSGVIRNCIFNEGTSSMGVSGDAKNQITIESSSFDKVLCSIDGLDNCTIRNNTFMGDPNMMSGISIGLNKSVQNVSVQNNTILSSLTLGDNVVGGNVAGNIITRMYVKEGVVTTSNNVYVDNLYWDIDPSALEVPYDAYSSSDISVSPADLMEVLASDENTYVLKVDGGYTPTVALLSYTLSNGTSLRYNRKGVTDADVDQRGVSRSLSTCVGAYELACINVKTLQNDTIMVGEEFLGEIYSVGRHDSIIEITTSADGCEDTIIHTLLVKPNSTKFGYYVKTERQGTGDGSSWENAMNGDDFATYLPLVGDGVTFYVAEGKYAPKYAGGFTIPQKTSSAYYEINSSVTIRGGYPADAEKDAVSEPDKYITEFSGDNSNMFLSFAKSKDIVLDGLTIQNTAQAILMTTTINSIEINNSVFYNCSNSALTVPYEMSRLKIYNSKFLKNGMALYIPYINSAEIDKCTFEENTNLLISAGSNSPDGYLKISNSDFTKNKGVKQINANIQSYFINCHFSGEENPIINSSQYPTNIINSSFEKSGALCLNGSAVIDSCLFKQNTFLLFTGNEVTMSNSTLLENEAVPIIQVEKMCINSCTFNDNGYDNTTTAPFMTIDTLKIYNSTFTNNFRDSAMFYTEHFDIKNNTILGIGGLIYYHRLDKGECKGNIILLDLPEWKEWIYSFPASILENNIVGTTGKEEFLSISDMKAILDTKEDGSFNLQNNGGFTSTVALKADVLPNGTSIRFPLSETPVTTDQRGVKRLENTCMGAYEIVCQTQTKEEENEIFVGEKFLSVVYDKMGSYEVEEKTTGEDGCELIIKHSLLVKPLASVKEYYVKTERHGTGDGSSWENAMNGEDFATSLPLVPDGVTFHVAEGTYNFNELVQGETANVLKEKAGFNIIGSYPKTAVTGDVPNAMLYKTLFTADADLVSTWTINGETVYDENLGDLNNLHDVYVRGVDFNNILIKPNYLNSFSLDSCNFNYIPATNSTLIYGYKIDTMNINSCYFDMNYVSAAMYLYESDQLNIKNSTFTKCVATFTNGGLMKTEYLKGDAYISNCTFTDCAGRDFINLYRDDKYNGKTYFYNNTIVGNGWPSTGDPMTRFGSLDIRNCVAVGNIYAGNYANDFYSKPLESHNNLFSDNFNNKTDDDLTISDDDLTTILDGEMVDGMFKANLADNGGFAPTIALKIDKLTDETSIRFPLTETIVTTDQRGVTRYENTCMGAYEIEPTLPSECVYETIIFKEDFGGNDEDDAAFNYNGLPNDICSLPCSGDCPLAIDNYYRSGCYILSKDAYRRLSGTSEDHIYYDWYADFDDNTYPMDIDRGYFMSIDMSNTPATFYHQRIDDLCENTNLTLSVEARSINAFLSATLYMSVESLTGEELAEKKEVVLDSKINSWQKFELPFTVPEGETSVVFKIYSDGGNSGNDFALDNIEVRLCKAQVEVNKPEYLCKNTDYTLSATYSGDPSYKEPVNYTWFKNDKLTYDLDGWEKVYVGKDLTFKNMTNEIDGYYKCIVSSAGVDGELNKCNSASDVIPVFVKESTIKTDEVHINVGESFNGVAYKKVGVFKTSEKETIYEGCDKEYLHIVYVHPKEAEYYVTTTGRGDHSGVDWDNAMNDEEFATYLPLTKAGAVFHVAEGRYYPYYDYNFDKATKYCYYTINNDVTIMGGYSSSELDETVPNNPKKYQTVFTGSKSNNNKMVESNNPYHLYYMNVDADSYVGTSRGLFIASDKASKVEFNGVRFNYCRGFYGNYDVTDLTLNRCVFEEMSMPVTSVNNLTVDSCYFRKLSIGGAPSTLFAGVNGDMVIRNSTITDMLGGYDNVLTVDYQNIHAKSFLLENSTLVGNKSKKSMIFLPSYAKSRIINNTFVSNEIEESGSLFYSYNSDENVEFIGNLVVGNKGVDDMDGVVYRGEFDSYSYNVYENITPTSSKDMKMAGKCSDFLDGSDADGGFVANLADNGGFTPTVALTHDEMSDGTKLRFPLTETTVSEDQRGVTRLKNTCIGAYELGCVPYQVPAKAEIFVGQEFLGVTYDKVGFYDDILEKHTDENGCEYDYNYHLKVKADLNIKEYYVKVERHGNGDGSSWENAMNGFDFATYLPLVPDGVTFHVAEGTYMPYYTKEEKQAEKGLLYTTNGGVTIIGGYAPDEEDETVPNNPKKYHTVLTVDKSNDDYMDLFNGMESLVDPSKDDIGTGDNLFDISKSSQITIDGVEFRHCEGFHGNNTVTMNLRRCTFTEMVEPIEMVNDLTIDSCYFSHVSLHSIPSTLFESVYGNVVINNSTFANISGRENIIILGYTDVHAKSLVIENSTFVGNTSESSLIKLSSGSYFKLINNTFVSNSIAKGQVFILSDITKNLVNGNIFIANENVKTIDDLLGEDDLQSFTITNNLFESIEMDNNLTTSVHFDAFMDGRYVGDKFVANLRDNGGFTPTVALKSDRLIDGISVIRFPIENTTVSKDQRGEERLLSTCIGAYEIPYSVCDDPAIILPKEHKITFETPVISFEVPYRTDVRVIITDMKGRLVKGADKTYKDVQGTINLDLTQLGVFDIDHDPREPFILAVKVGGKVNLAYLYLTRMDKNY